MRTNLLIVVIALFFMSEGCANAQREKGRFSNNKKEMKAPTKKMNKQQLSPEQFLDLRSKRLANELMLSDADAAKFIPLYKQYVQEIRALCPVKKENADTTKQCPKMVQLSDAEIEARILGHFKQQKKMAELQESYYAKFRKILSPRQIKKVIGPKGLCNDKMGKHDDRNCKDNRGKKEQCSNGPQCQGKHGQMGQCLK